MNFQLAKIGHSFKGSMAYYLHDKPQDGEQQPATSERVAWTETRNLATDGPHTATRIMIATAQQADELKAAAGVKSTGRKATAGPVFAFSLQWNPDELPSRDRDDMRRAADQALKVLKLDHLQAVLVCHRDTDHPHVHVIVNRINPENGKSTPIERPAVEALDRWARQYERERGQIVSPNREAKYAEQDRKRQQHPDPEKRRRYMQERNAQMKADRAERKKRVADPRQEKQIQPTPPTPPTPAAMLKDLGAAQRDRHRQEWGQLAADQKERRQAIYDAAGRHIRAELARAKEQARPLWSEFHKFQRAERRQFEQRERTLAGKVSNAIAAAKVQQRRGTEGNPQGFLSMAFAYVKSRDARQQAFTADQARMRDSFAAEQKATGDARVEAIKQARSSTLEKARAAMMAERDTMTAQHTADRAKVREAWRQLNLQRGRTPEQARREKPTMRDFDKAARPDPWKNFKLPTAPRAVAQPEPAPTPPGIPTPPARTMRELPRVDRPAEWAKTEQGRAEMTRHQPTPPARTQFGSAADQVKDMVRITPEQAAAFRATMKPPEQAARPAPAPAPSQQPPAPSMSRAEYWTQRAQNKAAEMSRDQPRDKGQNRNKDQDQDQEPRM